MRNMEEKKNITFKEIPSELYYKTVELKGRLRCKNWEVFLEKVCKIVENELDEPQLRRVPELRDR